ncbi:unnamed protein product, partial [Mesorhabditis belari]|uniref:Transthyretin-like family protein n=1 Tax=Mesorhabditis belari TaxID=2138241 RepID=A0AAF3F4M4_9BILA
MLFLFLLFITVDGSWLHFTSQQSVRAVGRLLCSGKPAVNVSIRLYDDDIFTKDTMQMARSNHLGHFEVEGVDEEITWIDPYIDFYHQCEIDNVIERQQCMRTATVGIPQDYISSSAIIEKTFELGDFELRNLYASGNNQKRCVNY